MEDRVVEERVSVGTCLRRRRDTEHLPTHLAVNHGSGRHGEKERQDRKGLHGLVTVNCPDPRSPLHEFEPL